MVYVSSERQSTPEVVGYLLVCFVEEENPSGYPSISPIATHDQHVSIQCLVQTPGSGEVSLH